MDPLESIKQGYFQECEELLLAMEEGLLAMENGESDPETINAVFRAVHSIKGGGGAFGFEELVSFAHSFETVMDKVRSNELEAGPDVMKVLLRASDMLSDHVNAVREGRKLYSGHDEDSLIELRALSGDSGQEEEELTESFEELGFHQIQLDDLGGAPAAVPPPEPAVPVAAPAPQAAGQAEPGWVIHFTPRPELYAKANEPALLIRELSSLGPIEVVADLSKLPPLETMDAEHAYIAWTITLHADAPRDMVLEVFEFASDDCDIVLERLSAAPVPAQADAVPPAPAEAAPEAAAVPEQPKAELPKAELPEPEAPAAAAPPKPAFAAKPAEDKKETPVADHAPKQTIRVDLDKIDRLGNVVGELVITQAMLTQRLTETRTQSPLLANNLAELEHLLRELQEGVMAIRTQPVKSVFQRMPRLVRELAAQTNKQVRLVVKGESTEVDKTVIERLGDPLTHMIRNAIDHGLETPDERASAGKEAEGVVTLSAEHRGGRIVIEVIDDGRGINRARVLEKATEKGLIQPGVNLSDEEIDNLIFLPGFSTAKEVSNISGRGVGMDVVRSSVIDLGGRIIMSSTPGKGSRFTMTLPLTLAVLDGMVVAVGDQTFVLPLSHIIESLQPHNEDVRPFGVNRKLLKVRDTYVPLIEIGELFNVAESAGDTTKGVVILVESEGTGRLALAVDQILGQRQVVIKSFEGNYRHIDGVGAATILGDGRVALIIDVDGIVSHCRGQSGDNASYEASATGTGP
jgi:two-component system, chemotaxis family, sensor kinase CheA